MKVHATIAVDDQGHVRVRTDAPLPKGEHDAVITLDAPVRPKRSLLDLPTIKGKLIDPNNSFRREDMYDDDGR